MGITFHRIPKGEVELRRNSEVVSADEKALGRLDGFVVADDHITHLVLERGHLWGRHEVAIPVSAVRSFSNDEVLLSLSKAEVEVLPRPTSVACPDRTGGRTWRAPSISCRERRSDGAPFIYLNLVGLAHSDEARGNDEDKLIPSGEFC